MILLFGIVTATAAGIGAYRISGPYGEPDRDDPRVRRILDPATGRLRLLIYDADGNGRFDTWSYMDGERPLRLEIDEDGDGRIDQWTLYRPDGTVEKIGSSSERNGHADSWQDVTPDIVEPASEVTRQ
jgi:hypothetical protein